VGADDDPFWANIILCAHDLKHPKDF
jgi:hypothetical protein